MVLAGVVFPIPLFAIILLIQRRWTCTDSFLKSMQRFGKGLSVVNV